MFLAIKRTLRRSLAILLVAGVIAVCIYALSQSFLAPPLARVLNVSSPLIWLNIIVEGPSSGLNRGRDSISLARGLATFARDIIVLGFLVSAVVVGQYLARHKNRN